MTERAPRFLIVRLGSLGDVIHAIPAVAALRARHPQSRIDWLVDPRYASVVRMVEGVDEVIEADTRAGVGSLLAIVGRLRRTRYEAVVDLQGLLKSGVLARAAGAARTIGLPREHLREPMARFLYSETPDAGTNPHVIHKGLALMRALGVEEPRVSFPLAVPPSAAAEAVPALVGSDRYALINPGAAWPNKRWPPERFGALAAALRDRLGLRSLVLWGPGEEHIASRVVGASAGAASLSPPTAIVDLFAIAARAVLMVSGDTGPLHIAGAMGTPLVALFGPTYAERNGPWDPADITLSRVAGCSCRYERRCRLPRPCIDDIAIDEVISAAERRVSMHG